eukprot:6951302-Prymnesium_polylepis.1
MRRTDTRSCGREAVKACVRDGSKKVAHHNSHVFFLPGVNVPDAPTRFRCGSHLDEIGRSAPGSPLALHAARVRVDKCHEQRTQFRTGEPVFCYGFWCRYTVVQHCISQHLAAFERLVALRMAFIVRGHVNTHIFFFAFWHRARRRRQLRGVDG